MNCERVMKRVRAAKRDVDIDSPRISTGVENASPDASNNHPGDAPILFISMMTPYESESARNARVMPVSSVSAPGRSRAEMIYRNVVPASAPSR